jgi:prepilin-type N-terminal cleavage/methylation domain-containing protein
MHRIPPSSHAADDGRRSTRILKALREAVDPAAVSRRLKDRVCAQHGFTLIEVLITALLVTLIAGAVAGGLLANAKFTGDQHRRSEAQALAQQDQERLKGLSAEQLDNLSQTYTATLDKNKFTVSSQAWYLNSTNGASCAAGGAAATYFKTISTVTWTNPGTSAAQTLATDESVITPPAGGAILAQFHDQTTAGLPGVSVSATGPDSYAATSDSNGCVIFTGLRTGTYNLTYTDIGYVDPNGNASPLTDTATVASTGIAAPSRGNPNELGLGGGITSTFGVSGTSLTFSADALSWYGSGGGYSMANYRTNTPSSPPSGVISTTPQGPIATKTVSGGSTMGLFPFASVNPVSYTNNYQLWAGTCVQERPPAGADVATVTPGSNQTSFVLTAPALDVNVTYKNSSGTVSQVAPTDVKVSFASGSGATCSDTWGPFTASATNKGSGSPLNYIYPAPFASSATSGPTASGSGQTGTVTVCADYNSGGNYYKASSGAYTDAFGSTTAISTIPILYSSTPSGKC